MLVSVKTGPEGSDEQLLLALAAGDDSALGPLYRRYVPMVFKVAAQSLGGDAAEDIVQEVFASVWKNAGTFDPARGAVRPWIIQIARSRVLNELRRRSRKPESGEERDASTLQELPDGASQPDQALWEEYRRSAIQKAISSLAHAQRQALSLAFFEDLTHEQVADTLKVPLGTTKTRIRSGIQQLRIALAAMAAVLVAVVAVRFAYRYASEQAREARTEAALRMVTASDTQVLRLVATSNASAAAHGNYRTRPGATNAVLTFSDLPPPPSGKTYQAWTRREGKWISLGQGVPDATGRGLIVHDERAPLAPPEALQVTLEPEGGSASPTGPPLISWPER
jgi:RNA polymerase sigma-70 factor (ECF subfamily)